MPGQLKRRTFLEFLGKGAIAASLPFPSVAGMISGNVRIRGIQPSAEDELILAPGLKYDVLIKWGDRISGTDTFGFNNDFTAFIPLQGDDDGILWVNHEYIDPLFVSGYDGSAAKTLAQVQTEQYAVGGSILRLRKDRRGQWKVDRRDSLNRRITASTEIPFDWPYAVAGKRSAIGTLANCSGGVTPWGTILTCEENYDMFYGERLRGSEERRFGEVDLGWSALLDYPPEHYGWVVEVDPKTGAAKKHVSMGRCAHECATVKELADGRLVVYTGDDAIDKCLYKFISAEPGDLSKGTLYVANTYLGRWMSLDYSQSGVLQKLFKDQTEVLVHLREAARLVGGSPLDRPEDIEIDPVTGHVFISLTNNVLRDNHYGSILKIRETDDDYTSLTFKPETFIAGGEETGFACPDNMVFDPAGNLWFASDISGTVMHQHPYTSFKNNGLFIVPRSGPQEGKVIQVGSAPVGAELTGPWFAPDGKTLFLSVQHPGENSPNLATLTSHWPDGSDHIPRPAVVAIHGDLLDDIASSAL